MTTNTKRTSRTALMLSAGLVALSIVGAPLAASAHSSYDDDYADQLWKQQVEQSRSTAPIRYEVKNEKPAYVPVPEFNAVQGPGPQG